MSYYANSSKQEDLEKMINLQVDLVKKLNNVVIEIRDILKERFKEINRDDNSFSSLKDKDLIRLEAIAIKNSNNLILNLVSQELRRRGLFVNDDGVIPVNKEMKR